MVIKGSSDELNPPVMTTGVGVARPAGTRSWKDYLALAIATCGVGYLPIAPGTWGSALGVGIYLLLHAALAFFFEVNGYLKWVVYSERPHLVITASLLIVVFMVTFAGVWASNRVERLIGRKDPGIVVIDEVAGQLITFLFVPFRSPWWMVVAGFFLFRAFDIWKPFPIRRLEALESGLGIMADDVLAGLYAATVLSMISVYLLL